MVGRDRWGWSVLFITALNSLQRTLGVDRSSGHQTAFREDQLAAPGLSYRRWTWIAREINVAHATQARPGAGIRRGLRSAGGLFATRSKLTQIPTCALDAGGR